MNRVNYYKHRETKYHYKIDKVPYGLAVFASNISKIGLALTEMVEQNFSTPDDMKYQKSGMMFGSDEIGISKCQNCARGACTITIAEALIRMDRLDEALKACEEIFAIKNRERNNYCDLFFNTCYYHAAVIKHRQRDAKVASKYFKQFFSSMKELCRKIIPNTEYNELIKQNAFDGNDIKTYFENSLKVFEAIYWKDYEFTKYYVEENSRNK